MRQFPLPLRFDQKPEPVSEVQMPKLGLPVFADEADKLDYCARLNAAWDAAFLVKGLSNEEKKKAELEIHRIIHARWGW